jgi:CAAX prenyl protease-like protein
VGHNATAAYLAPFLAILAAAMISRSLTGEFEWFYPLRVAAAAAALWIFRRCYRDLNWRFGWLGVTIGAVVFVLWIALDRVTGAGSGGKDLAAGFSHPFKTAQFAWLVVRVAGAVITVPIAEELAFRGFLHRRLASADFESVDWRRFSWLPFLISSIAFGLMHGERWLAGTITGMLYAVAVLRRGRIGEAVAAHATTNALLAAWVLITGNWQLW